MLLEPPRESETGEKQTFDASLFKRKIFVDAIICSMFRKGEEKCKNYVTCLISKEKLRAKCLGTSSIFVLRLETEIIADCRVAIFSLKYRYY